MINTIFGWFDQLEKVLYMVTELLIAQKQQNDLEENITTVAALVVSHNLFPSSSYNFSTENKIYVIVEN